MEVSRFYLLFDCDNFFLFFIFYLKKGEERKEKKERQIQVDSTLLYQVLFFIFLETPIQPAQDGEWVLNSTWSLSSSASLRLSSSFILSLLAFPSSPYLLFSTSFYFFTTHSTIHLPTYLLTAQRLHYLGS